MGPDRLDALVEAIAPVPGWRAVELGCGKADFLVRLLRRWPDITAEGFDRNPWFLAEAQAAADAAGVARRLSLIETDAPGALLADRSVDLAVAMGATGIVGDQAETVAFLASIVGPGGEVVFGDGVWVADPPDDGLDTFGMTRDELADGVAGLAALGSAVGLTPLSVELVSHDEWDAYETAYVGGITAWADTHADDPEREVFVGRAATFAESYAAWRRDSMGFAIGRFRR